MLKPNMISSERLTAGQLVAAVCAVGTAVADDRGTDTSTVIAECRQLDRQSTAVCKHNKYRHDASNFTDLRADVGYCNGLPMYIFTSPPVEAGRGATYCDQRVFVCLSLYLFIFLSVRLRISKTIRPNTCYP